LSGTETENALCGTAALRLVVVYTFDYHFFPHIYCRYTFCRRSESKVSDIIPISDSRSLDIYQALISGYEQTYSCFSQHFSNIFNIRRHQERKPKPRQEMKRWGKGGTVHPSSSTVNVKRTLTLGTSTEGAKYHEEDNLPRRCHTTVL
jgi:hypothetical protein